MKLDLRKYDTRYEYGGKPIVYVDYYARSGGKSEPYPTLLDSGAPFSFLPKGFREWLKLRRGPYLEYLLRTHSGPMRAPPTWLGSIEIQGKRIGELLFVDQLDSSITNFHADCREWGYPELLPYAVLGTDVFKKLLVAFDHKTVGVFLGKRSESTTTMVLREINRFSELRKYHPIDKQNLSSYRPPD